MAVWGEHEPAVRAFLRISRQWRQAANGRFLGLDYAGVEAGLRLAGVEVTPALWADVQLVEAGALEVLNGD